MVDQMTKKTAVLLFHLGGPDSLDDVGPFLYRFLSDPAIISLPPLWREPLAWLISVLRAPTSKKIYEKIGGASTIAAQTQQIADHLAALCVDRKDLSFHVCMRHGKPMIDDVMERIAQNPPDQFLCLPLFPQASTTTTQSIQSAFDEALRHHRQLSNIPATWLTQFPTEPGFIETLAEETIAAAELCEKQNRHMPVRFVFSAHGLPQRRVDAGDGYVRACEETALHLFHKIQQLKGDKIDWVLAYQSKFGPQKWTKPSLWEVLDQAAHDGCGVVIVPIAFIGEHVETLVELDRDARARFLSKGGVVFARAKTPFLQTGFIQGLYRWIQSPSA